MLRVTKIIPAAVVVGLVAAVGVAIAKNPRKYTYSGVAMDAPFTVTAYGSDVTDDIKELVDSLDSTISAYGGETEKINLSGGGEMSDVLRDITGRFEGLYYVYGSVSPIMGSIIDLWNVDGENPTVPTDEEISVALASTDHDNLSIDGNSVTLSGGAKLNFGAVGKGYALDRVQEYLDSSGVECAVVSFGSSTLLYGEKPHGEPFTVSVTDPDTGGELLQFECEEGFVSTSGGYERYFEADGVKYIHIFDEATGRPTDSDLTSVTVICDSGILSDFLSTRILLGGTAELDRWMEEDGIKFIAVDVNGEVYGNAQCTMHN
jgi:thiamine biosynthesis lipoprotein